jgi:hypothetical protein
VWLSLYFSTFKKKRFKLNFTSKTRRKNMKEILIYGALVAAVISASVPAIQQLTTSMQNGSTQINTKLNTEMNSILGTSSATAN